MATAQLWVKDMTLPQHDVQLLLRNNIHTARDFLIQTPVDLVERLNIPLSHAQHLLQQVAAQVAPPYVTALELHKVLHQHSVKLLTGLPALDSALRIGVAPAAITELVGAAGVGKSQFCYTLALQVALPEALGGLGATVLYLDTEGKLSIERISEMIAARIMAASPAAIAAAVAAAHTNPAAAGAASHPSKSPEQDVMDQTLNRVLIIKAHTPEELMTWLNQMATMIAQRDIKLLVLDSIAATLRTEFGGGEAAALAARGELLGQQGVMLKSLAETNRIPVVVTNQVTAKMTGPAVHAFQQAHAQQQPHPAAAAYPSSSSSSSNGADGQLAAALGTKWGHAVNVRLVLERRGDSRLVTIAKSPLSANVAVQYSITTAGVQQVPGAQLP